MQVIEVNQNIDHQIPQSVEEGDLFVFALPPFYQNAREIKAILDRPELAELLQNEAILSIDKVDGGYLVRTAKHELRVDVVRSEQRKLGPADFDLYFYPVEIYTSK